MITLSKIDGNLSVYRNNKVIIFGASTGGRVLYKRLIFFGIEIAAFSDNDAAKWGKTMLGCPIIAPSELPEMIKREGNVIIQIASCYQNEIEKQLLDMGISDYLRFDEAIFRLRALSSSKRCTRKGIYDQNRYLWDYSQEHVRRNILQNCLLAPDENICILCLPTKTGDHTLLENLLRTEICFDIVWHNPALIDWELLESAGMKVKVITAVRDPISQNVSMLFEMVRKICPFMVELDEFWDNGGDIDKLFKRWLQLEGCIDDDMPEDEKHREEQVRYDAYVQGHGYSYMIQKHFELFKKYVGDILSQPFDKEKGYSVMKFERCEVFVYQIEKLDEISDNLFEWLDLPPMSLLRGSDAGDEEVFSDVYKQAKKEIIIPKQYFDKCFEE